MSIFGVTWLGWERQPGRWILQLFFLTIAWRDRTFFIAIGGAPLAIYLSSRGDFSLCLGNARGEGVRTNGATTLLILNALALISRLEWRAALLGLFLLWLAEYTLPEA